MAILLVLFMPLLILMSEEMEILFKLLKVDLRLKFMGMATRLGKIRQYNHFRFIIVMGMEINIQKILFIKIIPLTINNQTEAIFPHFIHHSQTISTHKIVKIKKRYKNSQICINQNPYTTSQCNNKSHSHA